MTRTSGCASVETATHLLADDIARALSGAGDAFRLEQLAARHTEAAGLGALRALGTDVLAPFVLDRRPLAPADVTLLSEAVRAFPAPLPADPATARLWALRDWALSRTLADLGVDALGWVGLSEPREPAEDECAPWPTWTASLGRLSALALPALASPQREQAKVRRLDLGRGLTHALLVRDRLRAARLARWLALDARTHPEPLLPPALDHLDALAVDQPRVRLETAVARRYLDHPEAVR
ncbi:hypothetical protein ACFU7Y_15505 [Kitasatospora sp. NPDC057542]|uniref:hypothetical protein n=1 Tax=Streptomycetaceae TaxID=2062 RepID=UPI001CCCFA60|nr:hypothetical protein [Streptomyces sp. LS1784]